MAPASDPLPTPDPYKPADPSTFADISYGLNTESDLSLSHPWDPDFLPGILNFDPVLDYEHIRWVMFEQALDRQDQLDQEIDREPEIE